MLEWKGAHVRSHADRAAFILSVRDESVRDELENHPERWQNPSLPEFLEATADWVESTDQFYRSQGRQSPENRPWEMFAGIRLAARINE